MKKAILIALAILVSACSSPEPGVGRVDFTGLSEGWNEIVPGGETACANGDEFSFSFRPGSSEDIAIILPGGGACSNFDSCDLQEGSFLPGMLGSNLLENRTEGIYDLENDRNPIADHSILFVPYCTGDVFLGDQIVTYEDEEGNSLVIPHVGYLNTMAALNWLYDRVHSPTRIAVLGSSAGAIATPFYAGILAGQYPDAQINQLGDGAGAYQGPGTTASLNQWQGASLFGDATAQAFDNVRLHQYNAESDSVQVTFVRSGTGSEPDLPDLIRDNLQRIEDVNPDFRSYTMTGALHVILARNELYQDSLYSASLLDWVSAVINGHPVESIRVQRE
jgi:hypothetical protein